MVFYEILCLGSPSFAGILFFIFFISLLLFAPPEVVMEMRRERVDLFIFCFEERGSLRNV
jgi:hypothetical protein